MSQLGLLQTDHRPRSDPGPEDSPARVLPSSGNPKDSPPQESNNGLLAARSDLYYLMGLKPFGGHVDARWKIAKAVSSGMASRRFFRKDMDEWVIQALSYLHALKACQTDADREKLAANMPHLHGAVLLHESPDKVARGTVEARILARQSLEEVAAACGIAVETVQLYERLFFAVIGKLDAWVHIVCNAFGGGLKYWEQSEDDIDVILKTVGFLRGPHMLDAMLRYYTTSWAVPETLEGLSRDQLQELHCMVSMRATVLASVLPFNKLNRVLLLDALLQELERLIQAWPEQRAGSSQGGPMPVIPAEWESGWLDWRDAVHLAAGSLSGPMVPPERQVA